MHSFTLALPRQSQYKLIRDQIYAATVQHPRNSGSSLTEIPIFSSTQTLIKNNL
jgi:hypothetical protein